METETKIKELEDELEKTRKELNETKEHLKKYTAPSRSKTYYENHKEEIIKRVKEYKQTTNYTYEVSPAHAVEKNMNKYNLSNLVSDTVVV